MLHDPNTITHALVETDNVHAAGVALRQPFLLGLLEGGKLIEGVLADTRIVGFKGELVIAQGVFVGLRHAHVVRGEGDGITDSLFGWRRGLGAVEGGGGFGVFGQALEDQED